MEPCAHELGWNGGLLSFRVEYGEDYEAQVRAALAVAEEFGTPVCGVCCEEEDGEVLHIAYEMRQVLH
ncbi:hypothetical protein [Nevskia soli]|uniref:hypothetical protein n=1 Tax=Nevskia soli TaxID=418856 RepID=UPI0004A736E1|nr:hypothetical protein [Nevskia soli]